MTRDEALTILRRCDSWIKWDEATDEPRWNTKGTWLDGTFTVKELQALLYFAPKN